MFHKVLNYDSELRTDNRKRNFLQYRFLRLMIKFKLNKVLSNK